MKGLIGFGVVALAALCGVFWYLGSQMGEDNDLPFGMAASKPQNGECELLFVVSMAMPRIQGPKLDRGAVMWDKWVAEHFQLRDKNGKLYSMTRSMHGNSALISDQQAMNPEFYLRALVPPGEYTIDYIPVLEEKRRMRLKFTIGNEGMPFERRSLRTVSK